MNLGRGPRNKRRDWLNLGYWFLGTSLSVKPNYNGLHYLPANRAGLLVDRCKSENPDRLQTLAKDLLSVLSLLDTVHHGGIGG